MLSIFNGVSSITNSVVRYPEFEYIKNTYMSDLIKIEEFYKEKVYAVKNDHFLVKLITNIDVPMSYNIDRYANVADARALYISMNMRMTSSSSKGIFHNGVFYGNGVLEVILNDNEYFNPYFAEKNWKNICAVSVVLQPKSDLNLLLPNGKQTSKDDGIAIIKINIPLLAVQYRSFCLDQAIKSRDTGSLLGITHFIHMYVLPAMMYSQTDSVVMNRIMNLYYGKPMSMALFKHPFIVHHYENKLDNVLNKILNNLDGKTIRYEQILDFIPGFTSDNMSEFLILPDIANTTQVDWSLVLARLDIMKFLIDLGGANSIKLNMLHINNLKRHLFNLKHNHIFEKVLPKSIYMDTLITVDELLRI